MCSFDSTSETVRLVPGWRSWSIFLVEEHEFSTAHALIENTKCSYLPYSRALRERRRRSGTSTAAQFRYYGHLFRTNRIGDQNVAIAEKLGVSRPTVLLW